MKRLIAICAAVVVGVPALALAQGEKGSIDVAVQGGIGGWTGDAAETTTNVGPYYGVMGALNQSENLAFEVGYQGFSTSFSEPSEGRLSANRIQGDVRPSVELMAPVPWRPYAFGGVAVNYISAGDENTFGYTNSLQAEVPVGVGADFFTNSPIRVGARGTFNWNPGIGGEVSTLTENPSSWQAGLTASGTF